MRLAEQAAADLTRLGNLRFQLAELLDEHGTAAVLQSLVSACSNAAEAAKPSIRQQGDWAHAAIVLRKASAEVERAESHGTTLGDACRVLADLELGE